MKIKWIMVGILILLPFLVYLNCLHNDFVYDDFHLVSQNPTIRGLHKVPSIFGLKKKGLSYRPVRMASYALDYSLNLQLWSHFENLRGTYDGHDRGLNPFGYHFSSLVYHILTVVLVFLLINVITSSRLVAFITALLFSIHPVHVESVAYISGRRDILSTLFYLLGFYFFIRYRKSSKLIYAALFLLSYLLALGSKEMAVTLPLLCFCYDVVGRLQAGGTSRSYKKIFSTVGEVVSRYKYYYSVLVVGAASFTFYKVWVSSPSQRHSLYGESIYHHFLTVVKVMMHYFKLMVYPLNLTVDYSYNGFPLASSLLEPATFTALLLLVVVVYGLLWLLTVFPLLSFGLLWWFLTLLPVSQIFPHHELLAEHYLYLPSVGFFLFVALIIAKGIEESKWRTAVCFFLCAVVVLFSVRTVYRNRDWENATTLWEKTAKVVPDCVRAQNNLGVWYAEQGRYQEAIERHQIALKVGSDSADTFNNLGNAHLELGLYGEAEENYKKAIAVEPDYEKAYYNLGMVYFKEKRYMDAEKSFSRASKLNRKFANPYYGRGLLYLRLKDHFSNPELALQWAISSFEKAIRYNPEFAEARNNLGSLYRARGKLQEAMEEFVLAVRLKPDLLEAHKNLAELYEVLGKKDKAMESYARVVSLSPESGELHYRRGVLYRNKADHDNALAEFKRALELQFDCAEIHNELGIIYRAQGHYQKAVNEYKKALSFTPDYIEAYYNLALAYQSSGMDDEALDYYQRAVEIEPGFTSALNNMGSLYARRGDYEKAIALFKKVVEIKPGWPLAHNNLGNVYREQGHYSKAIEKFETAASLDLSYSDPHFNLAQIYLKDLKEINKAITHYKKSIAADPDHPRVATLKKKIESLEEIVREPLAQEDQ